MAQETRPSESAYREFRADLDAELFHLGSRPGGRPAVFPPDVAFARHREQAKRRTRARRRAWTVLAARHRDEFRELLEAETRAIYAESPPLPGDEVAVGNGPEVTP